MGFLFGLIWTLGVLFGVPFGPGVLLWGPFWALGPKVGPPERTGKGTVAQSGCQEAFGRPPRLQIRIAGCDHKGREQQASEVQIRTPGFKSEWQAASTTVGF